MSRKLTTEGFMDRARAVHGDRYDYTLVDYKSAHVKITIKCKEHGEFLQDPASHLAGHGCKDCAVEATVGRDVERNRLRAIERSSDYYHSNKKEIAVKAKEYREKNKDTINQRNKEYSEKNAENIRERVREWGRSPAKFSTFGNRLPEDARAVCGDDDELLVSCKHCGVVFTAANSQCKRRIAAARSTEFGESHLYCSDECKRKCDIYQARKFKKSERTRSSKARSCQQTHKKALTQLQCDETGYNFCERCGDIIIGVDYHHTIPVSAGVDRISGPEEAELLCAGCHVDLHGSC